MLLHQLLLRNNLGEELGRGDMVRIYADPTEENPDRQSIAIYPSIPGPPIVFTEVTGGEVILEVTISNPEPPLHE